MLKLAGCIIRNRNGDILLVHRQEGERKQWEIPGGKIEQGETGQLAAAREIQEELGVTVKIEKHLGSQEFKNGRDRFHYSWYAAMVIAGKPRICEPEKFDNLRYFSLADLRNKQSDLFSVNVHNFLASLEQ